MRVMSSVIIFARAYLPFVAYLRFSDVLSNDFKHLIVLLNLLHLTPLFSGLWKGRGSMERVECLRELWSSSVVAINRFQIETSYFFPYKKLLKIETPPRTVFIFEIGNKISNWLNARNSERPYELLLINICVKVAYHDVFF